jgi:hypothetical protein
MRSDSVAYRESATRALEVKEEQLDLVENFYKKFREMRMMRLSCQ